MADGDALMRIDRVTLNIFGALRMMIIRTIKIITTELRKILTIIEFGACKLFLHLEIFQHTD
jgi:hypothetical protein